MNQPPPPMSQAAGFTIKHASPADFGLEVSDGSGSAHWPKQYRSFNTHSAFNSELCSIAEASELRSADKRFVVHTATLQPFKAPKPGAKPSEDRSVVQFWDLPSGSWTFAAVFDGHGGEDIAEYTKSALPSRIRAALEGIEYLGSASRQPVSDALTKTIESFDKSIGDDLKAILPKNFEGLNVEALKKLVNDHESGSKIYSACIRCMRGSTAIIALIDPGKQNLWVANLGDCQGILTECPGGKLDNVSTILLSSPHNARIREEVQRIQFEHPGEPEAVLDNRVLGAIAVTRALGDFEFKLPAVYTTKLFMNATPGFRISSKVEDFIQRNHTPPYISATPEAFHRVLKGQSRTGEEMKYALVLCSDGLTDLYYARDWTTERFAQHIAKICATPADEQWVGLGGNLALHALKDALGEDLEQQSRTLTVDVDFQHLDDTTVVVLSW